MNTTRGNDVGSDTSLTLMTIMTILFRRKWVLILFGGVVVSAVALVSFLTPPVYRASSKLIVEREIDSEKVLLFRMNLPTEYDKHDRLNSEIEIIKSYPVAFRTVESMGLWDTEESAKVPPQKEQEFVERATKKFQKSMDVQNPKLPFCFIFIYC